MRSLQHTRPLAYSLPNSQLISSLPYTDQGPSSKANYLIQQELLSMHFDEKSYLSESPEITLSFVGSTEFEEEVSALRKKYSQPKPSKEAKENSMNKGQSTAAQRHRHLYQ